MENSQLLLEDGKGIRKFNGRLSAFCITVEQYRLAVAEFDQLWESGITEPEQRRMKELLDVIDPFETNYEEELRAFHGIQKTRFDRT